MQREPPQRKGDQPTHRCADPHGDRADDDAPPEPKRRAEGRASTQRQDRAGYEADSRNDVYACQQHRSGGRIFTNPVDELFQEYRGARFVSAAVVWCTVTAVGGGVLARRLVHYAWLQHLVDDDKHEHAE